MITERFSEGSSPLHRIDPRVKICIAFPLVFAVALSNRYSAILLGVIGAVFLVFIARIRWKPAMESLRVLLVFIALLWIFLPLGMYGEVRYTVGPFTLSRVGIQRALTISLKSFSIVLYIITLLSTSTIFALAHAMHHLRVPRKLLYLIVLSYRYIQVIHDEYLKMKNAMRVRGFKPKTNMHTYRTFAYLAGMLLVRSYDRAERIHNAMVLRGFQGRFYLLHHFEIGRKDVIFSFSLSLLILGIIWLEWIIKIG